MNVLSYNLQMSNVNAPSLHQRPPSVGMPRHALRRRMPRYIPSAVAARCRCFSRQRKLRALGRVPARFRGSFLQPDRTHAEMTDLLNYPTNFAEIWHEASLEHSKNKSLLAFCWEKSKSWSKMRFSDKILG